MADSVYTADLFGSPADAALPALTSVNFLPGTPKSHSRACLTPSSEKGNYRNSEALRSSRRIYLLSKVVQASAQPV
jgi:hypothetical protein